MKLSEMKKIEKAISRQLKFTDGQMEVVNLIPEVNGNINVYEMDLDVLERIGKDLINNIEDENDNVEFCYKLIPYVCDVQVDIELDEFRTYLENPSKALLRLMNLLVTVIGELYDTLDVKEQIYEVYSKISDKEIMTDEKKLEYLYDQLDKVDNKDEKKKIVKMINEIENKRDE